MTSATVAVPLSREANVLSAMDKRRSIDGMPGSPRSSTEELQLLEKKTKQQQEKKQQQRNISDLKPLAGNARAPPKAPPARAPMFSSAQEEPITMSASALANLKQETHFAEEEDFVGFNGNGNGTRTTSASKDDDRASKDWDVSYSTSALTRHSSITDSNSSSFAQVLGWIVQDFFGKITLQGPFKSPFVLHRIIKLIWNGRPNNKGRGNVLLLPSSSNPQQKAMILPASVEGIPNYGQTCFINAVLQSLASLDSVLEYCEWIAAKQQEQQAQDLNDYKRGKRQRPTQTSTVSELLFPLLQSLNGQSKNSKSQRLDPREMLWRIAQKNPQFRSNRHLFGWASSSSSSSSATGEQQDAQELLQALLEMMIVDAKLEDSYTLNDQQQQGLADYLTSFEGEEKKDNDDGDEVLTVLSDRYKLSPVNSSNNSLAGEESSHGDDDNHNKYSALNQVQMVDSNGILAGYDDRKNSNSKFGLSSSLLSSSLESSYLSTTSTVATTNTSNSSTNKNNNSRQPQPPRSMQILRTTTSSITKTPLSCWTGSLVQCRACHHNRAVRNQEWRDIPVVPTALSNGAGANAPPCRLEDCLRNFTQVERVSDVECGNCTLQRDVQEWQEEVDLLQGAVESLEKRPGAGQGGLRQELEQARLRLWRLQQQDPDEYDPNTDGGSSSDKKKLLRADALKCLVLTRLPAVLCLHVQRRYYDPVSHRMSKTVQHVVFGEYLDVSPYCAYGGGNANAQRFFASHLDNAASIKPPAKPIWYRLTSVVVHQGNAFGGHYVCYRKLPADLQQQEQSGDGWYYCSDDVVQRTTWEQVQRAQAYMLFYEAI